MDPQAKKKKYGLTMAPIECTEAWRRPMSFDHNARGIETFSYILVNRYIGKRTHVNTYSGCTGPGYNAAGNLYPIKKWGDPVGQEKELAKSLGIGKDNPYSRCRISDCPVAVLAAPPVGWTLGPILEPPMPQAGELKGMFVVLRAVSLQDGKVGEAVYPVSDPCFGGQIMWADFTTTDFVARNGSSMITPGPDGLWTVELALDDKRSAELKQAIQDFSDGKVPDFSSFLLADSEA
jgi:hypothetical protein